MACIQEQDSRDPWLQTSVKKLLLGSPISAHILYRQVNQYTELSLAACFQLELDLAVNVCLNADLVEGVRALLVDKDNQPNWSYKQINHVPADFVDGLFISPWEIESHPLRAL